MLVQVIKKSRIDLKGRHRTYQVGDWVDVGKQAADKLAAEGRVLIPEPFPKDAGVVMLAGAEFPFKGIETEIGEFDLPFELNIVWDGNVPLHEGRLKVGVGLLETWEVAVPLCKQDVLAQTLAMGEVSDEAEDGTLSELDHTRSVIGEMRVPVYETGLMFVRKCESTEALIEAWRNEHAWDDGLDPRLSFLRALYQVKPLVLALPNDWLEVRGG